MAILNRDSFKLIFDKHFKSLRNYLYYRCGDAEQATDIAQDVFLKLWEKKMDVDSDKVMPLLIKMGVDMVISSHRKYQNSQKFRNSLGTDGLSISPEDELSYHELEQKYETALAEMNDNQRVVFLMSRTDGLKYNEIAEHLNISVKAVEKRMTLALEYFRVKLQGVKEINTDR